MEKFIKTENEIKEQINFWFLKYHHKNTDQIAGTEPFTLFDKLLLDEQNKYRKILSAGEIPVLILKVDTDHVIINTTRRFINIQGSEILSIDYSEFEYHSGFKSLLAGRDENGKAVHIKTDGFKSEFGLRKTNGEVIYWTIPTGESGFAFWNVTKKGELIRRKYEQAQK